MRKYLDANIAYETNKMTKIQWLKARQEGIGGSDCSSVLGLNPYKSAISVYISKISEIRDGFKEENNSYKMELGNKLEEFVAREFCLKTGKKVRNINGILKNDKYPFAIANIDRAVVGERAFLECKVTNSFSKKEWEYDVPIHVQLQCYHYMAVTGATHCYVAALIGNEELIIHTLKRDEELIDEIMKKEENFWIKHVLDCCELIPDGSEDYSKLLREKYPQSKNESIILFMKEDKLNRYDEVVKLIKELEIEKKAVEQFLQNEMGSYETAFVGDRKITWKSQSRNSIDTKLLRKEHPDIADKFTKVSSHRVFKVH